ncbi:TolC family outer membrane protein [Pseudoduganella guangdongensis]
MKRPASKLRLLPLAAGAAIFLYSASASALGLLQAYEMALKNDPAYRAAYYTAESGKENRILGRAGLLPSLSGNLNTTRNRTTIEFMGKDTPRDYTARSNTVQARQSIFNLEALSRYKQGVAQSAQAEANFDNQSQEVILRVANAYLDVLFKQDQLALAKAELEVLREQMKVNELLFKKGEGTRTDALETQSRLDLSEAQLLEAQDAVQSAKDTLAGVIGADVDSVDPLRPGFRIDAPSQRSFDDWRKTAMENNHELRALEQGIEVARWEINKQRSGHTPRVDVVGTYGKSGSETTTTLGEQNTIRSIGLQVSVPLFAGGAVNAATRQAAANREKARADLEVAQDKLLVELRRNYNQVASSGPRIDALMKAVDSAKLLVTATEQSIKGGVRINLDLLTAQRQVYTVQRDLAQARYAYMLAALRLRAVAGTLTADDVRMFAAYFE